MEKPQRPIKPDDKNANARRTPLWVVAAVVLLSIWLISSFWADINRVPIDYSFFLQQLESGNVQQIEIEGSEARGTFKTPPPAPIEFDDAGQPKRRPTQNGEPIKLPNKFRVNLPENSGSRQVFDEKVQSIASKTKDDSEPLQCALSARHLCNTCLYS